MGLRKRTLLGELRNLKDAIEMQGLKEPTMPAVQHRLRALSDLEGPLQVQHAELQNLRELQEKQGGGENLFEEVETEWRETQRAFSDRKRQCNALLELLKKFQSCRGHLSNTMQRAEQAISDQASYMGKDNLQRSIAKVTEKTDAYMDNLRVGLELWEKQLIVGAEVDSWAGSKLAMFAESHPFHNEQQVLDMRDEIHANEENIEHFHKKSLEIQEMLQGQEAPLELQVMETQLRKRMQQVKELFTDCTDVFEELVAVKTHLAEKIEECQSAVESIQCSLSKVDASQPKIEAQIQDLCDDLEAQEEQAEAVLKEVGLISSVASPQVLEALSVDCSRLREAISRTKDMIHLKREERDKGLLKVIQDERQSFGGWFQDLQLSVNECFENPESRTDVETSLQRLIVPPQQLSEFNDWLKEQQDEVDTFKSHCHNRQKQMESLLGDLNSLQRQHDSFRDWLQTKEKQSVESDRVKLLLKDLQDESGRVDTLSEVLASVRRQGVRAESLLKDGDNLIQRYRNLEARLQKQADAQSALEGEFDKLNAQAESTRTWITTLLQPLTSHSTDTKTEEMKHKAQAVLSSRPEGDAKVNNLRTQSESLCEQEDLEEARKKEIQRSVRETEEQWRTAVQTAEQALNKAESQALLDKDLDAFRTQYEKVQSWIREQEQNLQSLGGCMQAEEKRQVAQANLSSKPDGESRLRNLKEQCQRLCENQSLDESTRRELQDSVRHTEEQWKKVLQAAEEALNKAETDATIGRDYEDFKTNSESAQSWIKEQKQRLLSHGSREQVEERLQAAQAELRALSDDFDIQSKDTQSWIRDQQQKLQSVGIHMPPEERSDMAQTIMSSKPDGDCKVNNLRRRGQTLCDHPDADEGSKVHVQQAVRETEEQWRVVLQAAKQVEAAAGTVISEAAERRRMELREFDAHQQETGSWFTDLQRRVDSLSSQTRAEDRLPSAQAIMSSKPDGDSKLQELKRRGQSLCGQDLEEHRKQELQQKTILSCKPEGDSKLTELRRQSQSLSDQEGLDENVKREAQQTVKDSEAQAFRTQAGITETWVKELQQQAESKGSGTQGSQAQLEDRLNTAKAILSSKSNGEAQVMGLKTRAQSLCEQKDLEGDKKLEVQQALRDTEQQWRKVLRDAEDTQRQLRGLVERLVSCHCQRGHAAARLCDLQKQISSLPRVFPWPGLGERRQTVEQARTLLDQTTALAPVLSDVRTQTAELFEITQDQSWSDPSWAAKEASIPALLKELTDAVTNLEQGVVTERQCTQLVEQHEAAQDWLREHVKGLGAPPADRQGLHSAVNTLKALLQTVDREQKEMKELDSARDSLLSLCTPGGRDALTLEISHLHDLCTTSEQEVKERLGACETRLAELDSQLARRAQGLKERGAALQWELRSLDQALSYSEPQNNVAQLQQHWHSLQNCEKSLEDLGVKVHDLYREVKATPATDELPTEIITAVESLQQQHDR
ncbi:Nesprin-2 [Nibea albiflora]|uniref:Nesprin-2 n=1 Tax=Nibea albiflora TaxID=240163 RepID=A0ACB7FGA9_NIBAL|nr:Nesprin-2 [Nibea albiflora]